MESLKDMADETLKNTETIISSDKDKMELYSDQYPFRLSLRISNFENESDFNKYVKKCEMLVRSSIEYKYWREYIVDVLGQNMCLVTGEMNNECTIEVHHHVPSLFVLAKTIINKNIDDNIQFSSFDICIKMIELHFQNKIGYVTVLKSLHEKFHNGYMTFPLNFIKGDYMYFMNYYSQYIDEDNREILEQRLAVSEIVGCDWTKDHYLMTGS